MSHSYSSNRVHLVFSTKNREKRIAEELQVKLWPYMAGISRNHGFEAIKIGGVDDHCMPSWFCPRRFLSRKRSRL
jgi:REP element-mobilizing transposase RayT